MRDRQESLLAAWLEKPYNFSMNSIPPESYQRLHEKMNDFVCQRCNECCRQPGLVRLTQEDTVRAAEFLKLSLEDFLETFTTVESRRLIALKKGVGEACIFLQKGGCEIHPAKPQQCRDFPSRWLTLRSLEYCQGLKILSAS